MKPVPSQVLEGGIRIPFMIQWKGHLPAGKTYRQPVISLDILPTAVGAAGGKLPEAKLDGVNLLPHLKGEKAEPPHEALFWRFGQQSAVRKGQWKLVKVGNQPVELYDLAADIGESRNLAEQKPEMVKELNAAWDKWNSQLEESRWKPQQAKPKPPGRKKARARN